ncbi:hypothetical protein [Modestobacter altitudinis]|uniref:hypothetical protein n=1 Tax=Modestobacter altitudinis TaxID=2213158 RepID=UPI00110CD3A0|nr:hypothetical protein [Modestobacter altitudinis]
MIQSDFPELDFAGSKLVGIIGDRVRVRGNLNLNRTVVKVSARFRSGHVEGNLSASGALLGESATESKVPEADPLYTGYAFEGDRLKVDDYLFLDDGFTAIGGVNLTGARVGGNLELQHADLQIAGPWQVWGCNAEDVVVEGNLDLRRLQSPTFCLTSARVNSLLLDDLEMRPPLRLWTDGWQVNQLYGAPRESAGAARRLLDGALRFNAQSWHELASCYERAGAAYRGRYLRWQAARRITQKSPLYLRPLRWVYGATTGYGYYPLIAAVWLALLIVGGGLLGVGQRDGFTTSSMNVPATAVAGTGSGAPPSSSPGVPVTHAQDGRVVATSCPESLRVPCFDPWIYAAESVLPTANLGQSQSWQPTGNQALSGVFIALRVAGWAMTALLIAGVTGLLRKT